MAGDYDPSYPPRLFLNRVLIAGVLGAGLTALGYLPVIYVSGWKSLFGNYMVEPLTMKSFIGNLFPRMAHTWAEWTETLPLVGVVLLVAGLITAMVFNRKLTGQRFSLPLAALAWLSVLLWIQRVAPQRRFWLWLLPVVLIYSAAGLVQLIRILGAKYEGRQIYPLAVVGVMMVSVFGLGSAWQHYDAFQSDPLGDIEAISLAFNDRLSEDDVVLVAMVDGPSLWYYFLRYGITDRYLFDIKHRPFKQALVVVNTGYGETVEFVAKDRGNFADVLDMTRAQLWMAEGDLEVYSVPHK